MGNKNTTIARLRKLMFGATSETSKNVLGDADDTPEATGDVPDQASVGDDSSAAGSADSDSNQDEDSSTPPSGHGRHGADDYPGADQVDVTHPQHAAGDVCPECGQGKLYEKSPGVLVRFVGRAPVHATVYRLQKLRCHLCGKLFTAPAPADAGDQKYDHTVASMIGLLKYGSGCLYDWFADFGFSACFLSPSGSSNMAAVPRRSTACRGCRGISRFLWQPRLSGTSCMRRPR